MPHRSLCLQYGGTFDPVHNGHLAVACAARDALDCDVHLMPAADPPHKGPTQASAAQRAQMLRLAIQDAGQQGLQLDLRELHRDGPSYTIDTLIDLRAELGDVVSLAILIGGDSFLQLERWHRWKELFCHAHLVIAERPGHPIQAHHLPEQLRKIAQDRWAAEPELLHRHACGLLYRLALPLRPESASEVRRRIAADEPWQSLVPPSVADFIEIHRLYRAPGDNVPA